MTSAFGMAAPLGSVIVPLTVPPEPCASTGTLKHIAQHTRAKTAAIFARRAPVASPVSQLRLVLMTPPKTPA